MIQKTSEQVASSWAEGFHQEEDEVCTDMQFSNCSS